MIGPLLGLLAALAATPEAEGWIFAMSGQDGMKVYTKPGGGTAANPRLWVRFELRPEVRATFHSSMVLYEFNCRERQFMMLSYTGYADTNLRGANQGLPRGYLWEFYAPGTVNEGLAQRVCPPT